MAAENVDVGAGHSKMLAGPGGQKAPSSMGKLSPAGVLRLRATSAVSRDPSVRRSAQDDGFVGRLEYKLVEYASPKRSKKSQALRMTIIPLRRRHQPEA